MATLIANLILVVDLVAISISMARLIIIIFVSICVPYMEAYGQEIRWAEKDGTEASALLINKKNDTLLKILKTMQTTQFNVAAFCFQPFCQLSQLSA